MDTVLFNTIVGVVLALAAIFAFLLQRARYLREIEPDIELTWAKRIRVEEMASSLKECWAYYIDVNVENKSRNHAKDMLFSIELWVFPERGRPRVLQDKFPLIPRLHDSELMAGRTIDIPIYVGLNYTRKLYNQLEDWGKSIGFDVCGFHTIIHLEYYSNRELLLFFLIPWRFGRKKLKRSVSLEYGFAAIQKGDKTVYVARKWEFTGITLSEWDDE